jgi:hypothetical protein
MILKPYPPISRTKGNMIQPVKDEIPIAFYGRGGSVPVPGYCLGGEIFNKKERDYTGGAYVNKMKSMTARQIKNDSIKSKLEIGGLVIPVKYTPMVKKWMKAKGLSYKGPKEKRKSRTQSAIVQPGELIVDKKYADVVIAFLKTQNIHLPNT